MHFCTFCDNMLFIRNVPKDEEIVAEYFCKYCSHVYSFESLNHIQTTTTTNIPKYIAHDVTLPRRNDVKCTNKSCTTTEHEQNEVILLRQDNQQKIYMYYCNNCQETFKV